MLGVECVPHAAPNNVLSTVVYAAGMWTIVAGVSLEASG